MPANGNNPGQFVFKKAYEIAYALFRLAGVLKRPSFADQLESRGLALLSAAIAEDHAVMATVSRGIECLLKFGGDLGAINRANVDTIATELKGFNAAIAELEKSAKPEAVGLADIFSKSSVSVNCPHSAEEVSVAKSAERIEIENNGLNGDSHSHTIAMNNNGNGGNNVVKVAMRQSAILERIRQNHDCRLKDIQEALQDVSERTIRYDLQNLLEQGLIDRSGNGGPATFYRAKA